MNRKLIPAAVLLAVACGSEPEADVDPEARLRSARADSVRMAEALYDASHFDTIQWESEEALLSRGRTVWTYSCQKCHGSDGRGGGEFAVQAALEPPDLTASEWPHAGDLATIRRRIFVGHEKGMPNWGLHGLKYRDIDAVATYIDQVIRQ